MLPVKTLTAPGAAADDEFGTSVAIFKKVVVVGTFHGEAAYVFPRSANYDNSVTLTAADDEKATAMPALEAYGAARLAARTRV